MVQAKAWCKRKRVFIDDDTLGDICSDAYLKIRRHLDNGGVDSTVYVSTIIVHVVCDWIRKDKRIRRLELPLFCADSEAYEMDARIR